MAGFTTRPLWLRAGVLALVLALSGGLPVAPALAEALPDLRVSAAFDKPRYIGSDLVKVTLTITNAGTADAPDVHGVTSGDVELDDIWTDPDAEPVLIRAGETRVAELTGYIWNAADPVISVNGNLSAGAEDANRDDNFFRLDAPFGNATGSFAGSIFTDPNANGRTDPGEFGLDGVTITITGGLPSSDHTRTTDGRGRFSFAGVPTGRYQVTFTHPMNWLVHGLPGNRYTTTIVIDDAGTYADVRLPAVRPLYEALTPSVWFDRETYQPGETVGMRVVLSNRGSHALTGITADCGGGPDNPQVVSGPGWGPLAPGGPGVTVPSPGVVARSVTRSVAVSSPMPATAPKFGHVEAGCFIGAAGYPEYAWVYIRAMARVPGVAGSGRGQIYHDRNGNGWSDDGEGLAAATVVLTDQQTGATVARSVTDGSGEFAVDGLPAAEYDLRVEGPWRSTYARSGYQFRVAAAELHYDQRFSVVPGADGAGRQPNLRVSVAFEKPAYNSGDRLLARVTVTNIGPVAAEGVRTWGGGGLIGTGMHFDTNAFGDFRHWGPGVRLQPGETRVIEVPGTVWEPEAGVVTFTAEFEASNGDANQWNNAARAIASVTATRGSYAGTLYGDRDGDAQLDPGEELGQVRITLSGLRDTYTRLTNAQGRFRFEDIPTGRYNVRYDLPASWTLPQYAEITVDEQDEDVLVRATRSQFAVLQASIAFTEDSYAPGETAHLKVTLTNRGSTDLTGITAFCSGPGNGNELYSAGPGWGDLADGAAGVTVPAGRTRTFDVRDTVPEDAFTLGYVVVICEIGSPPTAPGSAPASAEARVPGATGTAGGRLIHDRNSDGRSDGDGVPNTKIVLIEGNTGQVAARSVTDADGRFVFRDTPAYHYQLLVVGPWRPSAEGYGFLQIVGGQEELWHDVWVVPGPDQADPDAQPGSQPGGSAPPLAVRVGGLAVTGASIVGLAVAGLVALLMGLGLVLVRRRRPVG